MERNQIRDYSDKLNIQKGVICFYAYFALMTLTKALGLDSSNQLYMVIFVIGLLLLCYKIIVTDYERRELLIIATIIGVSVVCAMKSRNMTLVLLVITVAGLKYCEFRDVVKVAFAVRVVITSAMILLSLAQIFNPGLETAMNASFQLIEEYHFGYYTPNNAFINVFLIIVMYLYLNYEKINYKHIMISGGLILWFFSLTYSRTGTLLFFCLLLLIFLDKFLHKMVLRKAMYIGLTGSTAFCGLFSWLVTILYRQDGSGFWLMVNNMFSGRPNITQHYYNQLPISLFPGDYTVMQSLRAFGFVDNMYMNVFLHDGILLYVLLLIFVTFANYRLYKGKCYKELIFITIFSVFAVLEEFPLNPIVNPFVLVTGILLYRDYYINGKKFPNLKGKRVEQRKSKCFNRA